MFQQVPYVYAAGDCIGFPALASTSAQQGRVAASHMWGSTDKESVQPQGFPYGIYTIPEISMVGESEQELTKKKVSPRSIPYINGCCRMIERQRILIGWGCTVLMVQIPYEVGKVRYEELARGEIVGGAEGVLKILFHAETLKILGVHCIGENATEIVHVGQLAMDMGLDITYFKETVFNYPTFAEAYRSAAFDGLGRVQGYSL